MRLFHVITLTPLWIDSWRWRSGEVIPGKKEMEKKWEEEATAVQEVPSVY